MKPDKSLEGLENLLACLFVLSRWRDVTHWSRTDFHRLESPLNFPLWAICRSLKAARTRQQEAEICIGSGGKQRCCGGWGHGTGQGRREEEERSCSGFSRILSQGPKVGHGRQTLRYLHLRHPAQSVLEILRGPEISPARAILDFFRSEGRRRGN